ncbi:DegT/DnrJ/EryC1/StrS family aminotransferase [[Clostridium] polysaccharolyticum]|uniref:Perosamine synthetase n=1 Tax=[Clostridium] polysaccharolyticum TaxID=29364 RepID=A0A1I0CQM7_9FIRM|nr:aminotransferase class I/II-fold pyridoxal phosphate-dependent enzyme [[Clostridium] polysaccharolyticum]SET22076.1 perosamine synthetase [[Clostridium] polysaccharolyticum]
MFKEEILKSNIINEVKEKMKEFFGVSYCTMVSTGTAAIEVALKALELPRGSKVIIPDISFIATATAVANVGLIPVYADCTQDVWGMPLSEVERLYKKYPDAKACIVVHFSGIVNRDIERIASFCRKEKIYLIEDCAQVFGASFQNKKCGLFGDIGTFSFQTSKIITCGEGGMVIAEDKELANKIQAVSDWGLDYQENRLLSLSCGNNRINPFAAAYLGEQLNMCDEIFFNRRMIYEEFSKLAEEMGFEVQFRAEQDVFSDMPFFLLLKVKHNRKGVNVLHPINEYPMHLSKLVPSIIQIQYPDLLEEYKEIIKEQDYSGSIEMVNQTEFLPMYGVTLDNMKERFAGLL